MHLQKRRIGVYKKERTIDVYGVEIVRVALYPLGDSPTVLINFALRGRSGAVEIELEEEFRIDELGTDQFVEGARGLVMLRTLDLLGDSYDEAAGDGGVLDPAPPTIQ